MVFSVSIYSNRLCLSLHELALELDGALGSLERYVDFHLGSSSDISAITIVVVDTRSVIKMYISRRQPVTMDSRGPLATKVHISITT